MHFHILPCRIHAHVGCEHGAVPVRTETCPCHTGHEGSGTRSPEPPTPWHLLRRFFQTSKPHEGFHWGLPREAELPAETQPGERGASIWQSGQVPASCRRGGVCAPLAQQPALRFGAKCHVGITGVCSHPEPLKTGAPRNRSSEASASACLCVHRVACKCLCKVHTYGYLGTGCACTRVCEC